MKNVWVLSIGEKYRGAHILIVYENKPSDEQVLKDAPKMPDKYPWEKYKRKEHEDIKEYGELWESDNGFLSLEYHKIIK